MNLKKYLKENNLDEDGIISYEWNNALANIKNDILYDM